MKIYEKPARELVVEAVQQLPRTFSTNEIKAWFREHYPKIREKQIRDCLRGMSVNDPNRPSALMSGVLYKLDRSNYTRYDPQLHGAFDQAGKQEGMGDVEDEEAADYPADQLTSSPQMSEFVLEQHLEDFMERNWPQIEFGIPLDIWSDEEGNTGRQYPTDVGFIDFLCRNRSDGSFVIVELKKGRTSDAVVGQCQRYMGWVKRKLETEGRPVYGLIVAAEVDEKLQYALEVAPNITARRYRVRFELVSPEEKGD